MFRAFLLFLLVGSACSQANDLLKNLMKKKHIEKAAFAELDGTILVKSVDYPLRQGESTAFAKGLANWETLTGKTLNHEGLAFTVTEAMPSYLIATRGNGPRVLTVHKTETFLVYTFCGKLIKEAECQTKSTNYAQYLRDMGY